MSGVCLNLLYSYKKCIAPEVKNYDRSKVLFSKVVHMFYISLQ